MPSSNSTTEQSFASLGITPKLLNILTGLGFVTPTPIQGKAIPHVRSGRDVIGIAQTGTGKTLAFVVPMIERIATSKQQGVIIAPTRELAEQIADALQKIGGKIGLRHALIIGGASMDRQFKALRRRPHVIIGTPGRMKDHLDRGTLKLGKAGILVLDEADRMLDMGFAPQINRILQDLPRKRQTLLFSATMPSEIERLATRHLTDPVRVQVSPAGTVAQRVNQELFVVPHAEKNRLLDRLLSDYNGTVLVFSRTKHGAKRICRSIRNMNHAAAEIHSNLTTSQRRRALAGFKNGTVRVMVATDIASRGIDVSDIELVINYDLPDHLEDYVHRIGRTGRAGKQGKAISFVHPDQRRHVQTLERLVRHRLEISPLPELPAARPGSASDRRYSPGRRRRSPSSFSDRRRGSGRRSGHHRKQPRRRSRQPRIST